MRGAQKRWMPGLEAGPLHHNKRFVNPMPVGALPIKKEQKKGEELAATKKARSDASIASFWSIKGMPLNGKGKKKAKANAGNY